MILPILRSLIHKLGWRMRNREDIEKIVLHSTDICGMNCKYCSRAAPFSKSGKSYAASDFIPWLDFLSKCGIRFGTIAISGGEPFLHQDIFGFIDELKCHFPDKTIRLTTNFSWANDSSIRQYAPRLRNLDNIVISRYPRVVEACGGNKRFNQLVRLFREHCPHIVMEVQGLSDFIAWELHNHIEPVRGRCTTERAKCHTLDRDGIIKRCVIACGAQNIREYRPILESNREYWFDLRRWDKKEFLDFVHRFPFDLCWHCTFTRYERSGWKQEDRLATGELTPADE